MQLRLSDTYLNDEWWQNKIEFLPDGSLIQVCQVRNLMAGLPFKVFPDVGVPAITYGSLDVQVFHQFFEVYVTSKRWGLPNGRGWANESELCVKVLMHFDELQDKIDAWRINNSNP